MRKILAICFLFTFSFCVFVQQTFADKNYVISETLSTNDIKAFLNQAFSGDKRASGEVIKIYGIFQEGKEATVFLQIYWRAKQSGYQSGLKDTSLRLIRLNSGNWFSPGKYLFVTK